MRHRWLQHLADEAAEIVAHGGRGTIKALQDHCAARFGDVSEADLREALELVHPWVREAFA